MDHDKFERVEVDSAQGLWDWLAAHHGQAGSVYLVTWKAAHRGKYVSRDQVLDALLAYGWIDGRRLKLDADRTMQLIGPRKRQAWTATYRARVARLEAEGRMQPPGIKAVVAAKAAGLWEAHQDVDALQEPEDLIAALEALEATAWWQQAAPSYRRNVLRWIAGAKRPQTRAKRVGTVAGHAARGEKVPQF